MQIKQLLVYIDANFSKLKERLVQKKEREKKDFKGR